ncbi:transposase [Streptomyces sp. NPDC052687]|uniref:transposase n=1 Tax=Streptomyces sp. NPDC052687 TaxID=3154759 RepID=UPI0034210970
MTDAKWAVRETLLPKGKKPGRPPTWARRRLIDGIRFRVRTAIPWRDLPAEYGPWGRVYDLRPAAEGRPAGLQGSARGRVRHQPPRKDRAVATRYDKLAVRYEATVLVAAINGWL